MDKVILTLKSQCPGMANDTLISQEIKSLWSLIQSQILTKPTLVYPSHCSFTSHNLQFFKRKTQNVCASDLARIPDDYVVVVNSPTRRARVRCSDKICH